MTQRMGGEETEWDDRSPGREEPLLLAALASLAGISSLLLVMQSAAPEAVRFGGLTIDRLSAALTLLVASIGAIAFRFSQRYLEGEPGRRSFLRWLTFTITTAYMLMLATNLLVLYVAWSLTSLGLHRLLTHGGDHPEQQRPARKKFLISRVGDLALIGAIVLIWRGWGTFDLHVFLASAVASPAEASGVALLIVVAALTKSAQFPFHSWLPETMEAPTPVSALMHAGIINAGGALLLRFAPLLVRSPESLFLLALTGTLTAFIGMLAMWAQVKVKRTLAWSTVSQMGFMMVQCGLAAFPAAALHIVGHGCYKAWSFLRSGELPTPAARALPASPFRVLGIVMLGIAFGVPAIALSAWLTGFAPLHSPGELALSAIVAMSVGQLWAAMLARPSTRPDLASIVAAAAATPVVVFAAFALYRGVGDFLAPVLGDLPAPSGPLAWSAAVLPIVAIALLAVIQAALPALARTATGRAFHVHALNGFYFGAVADRFVNMIWIRFAPRTKEVTRA